MAANPRPLGLMLMVALSVVGCSKNGGDAAGDGDRSPPALSGHTFVSTQVDGVAIPGGGPLSLAFAHGRLTADAGCNSGNGPVTLDNGVLRAPNIGITRMACPGDRAGADAWMTSLLDAAPAWSVNGPTLTLRTPDRTVTLLDKKLAQPDKPLRGTDWVVVGLITPGGQVTSATIDQVKPHLTIAPDGTVRGGTGCNTVSGHATEQKTSTSETIIFHLTVTEKACEPPVMDVERSVLTALDGAVHPTVDGDTLILRNDNGQGLTLHAQ